MFVYQQFVQKVLDISCILILACDNPKVPSELQVVFWMCKVGLGHSLIKINPSTLPLVSFSLCLSNNSAAVEFGSACF